MENPNSPPWNIFIADGLHADGLQLLQPHASVSQQPDINTAELLLQIPAFDALIVRNRTQVNAAIFEKAAHLKVVGRAGAGVDNIDLAAAAAHKVTVVNAPLSTSLAVAEHTLALLFALARPILQGDAALKSGQWNKTELDGIELNGKTLGVMGMGRIGSLVAERARALGMRVLGYDTALSPENMQQCGAQPAELADLLANADFISLHLPLTPDTRRWVNGQMLAQMKRGVRLVCTARGGILDETALLGALESGQVAGAALDVYAKEPPGMNALVSHPRVIATPHIAAQTVEAQARAAADIASEVLAALRGEPLRWKVV